MTITLYGHGSSGNVYKVQILLDKLGIEYNHVPSNFGSDTQTPAFLEMNPNGKVPVLDDNGFHLWESGAILCYLAKGTEWSPEDKPTHAKVMQWMFFEQYSHEPYVATSRAIAHFESDADKRVARMAEKRAGGEHALQVMEAHLADHEWFVGSAPTIADIALYAYTHVADEGGFELAEFPAIQAWLGRFDALGALPPMQDFATLAA